MKTLFILLLAAVSQLSYAQCDKNFLLNFNEITEIRGTSSSPMKSEGTISFSKNVIIIKALINGSEKLITSQVRSVECDWSSFLKEGKSTYQLYSGKGNDVPKDAATLVLEGTDGKLKVSFRPPSAELQFQITQTIINP
ncbi:hypothetical protein [Pedobacter sp. SYSU D00535]|uniref:hypothetical protein n=1 Tax=Pedobacter sp. SYSU D00535 TaxID=2810308 RepID=UPI001A9633DB|nr:hypothetical protein [Pedobacter sp. SYSU D00535]